MLTNIERVKSIILFVIVVVVVVIQSEVKTFNTYRMSTQNFVIFQSLIATLDKNDCIAQKKSIL